jgi:hypothetical protein
MFSSNTTQVSDGGYQISRSLRFNIADSANLSRTPATTTNRTTWTWSGWVKRASFGSSQVLFGAGPDGSNYTIFYFSGTVSEDLEIFNYTGGVTTGYAYTNSVFRDPSAWYHVVLAVDTTQGTSADRTKIYVNNVLQPITISTAFGSFVNTWVNTNNSHRLGSTPTTSALYGGYMTDVNFVDGSQLTPSSFGETNAQTGVWQPKAYSGSYGTNGFYLNFSDNSNTTAATLGADYSGNGNNWTPNNFSVTAGAGNDSLVDSPTSYGVDTGVGGTVRGNYCTLNPISTAGGTFTNGNLDWASPTTDGRFCISTIPVNFMNCYCEVTIGSATSFQQVGVYGNPTTFNPRVQYRSDGQASIDGTAQATYASFTTNDIIGIAYNSSTGSTSFYKNGTLQGSMTATSATVTQYFAAGSNSSGAAANYTFNFGQRPFAYTAPSGFKALCTQNLPTPTIGATTATQAGKYFNPVLWTGNGGTQSVTGVGFQPDFTWVKRRDNTNGNGFEDAVRGAGKTLESNNISAEVDYSAFFTAFTSDGFNMAGGGGFFNANAGTYVAWNWKANGAGSTNTAGSITSTASANTTSGCSVVTFTGTNANATIGHGLGVAPAMIIMKVRNAADDSWHVYHQSLTSAAYRLQLNSTAAEDSQPTVWNSTAPTSTVFSVGNNVRLLNQVAYCFAPIAGYSAFGKYTGNGSTDGPFVFTGFRPAFVLVKKSDSGSESWVIVDTTRNTSNVMNSLLRPNTTDAEVTATWIDALSNGFKCRETYTGLNASGGTYIYMAFASNPFKYSLAR